MKQRKWFVFAILILLAGVTMAGTIRKAAVDRMTMKNLPLTGAHERIFSHRDTPPPRLHSGGALDSAGTMYIAGDTWWDMQHNGSVGKMIGVDNQGYVHMTWTKGQDNENMQRDVYYNCWVPTTQHFDTMTNSVVGVPTSSSTRSGYATIAVKPDGWAFPAFHQVNSQNKAHSSAAIDYQPHYGAFSTGEPAYCFDGPTEMEIIWPKIAVTPDGLVHMVSTESPLDPDPGIPQRIYYSRGAPVIVGGLGYGFEFETGGQFECGGFDYLDTVMVISPVICASKTTNRIAIAWSHSRDTLTVDSLRTQYNNDLYVLISEDGGHNWNPVINVTHFCPPASEITDSIYIDSTQTWVPDSVKADMDTNRVYTDCDAIFDDNNNVHVVFTTLNYYAWEGTISRYHSDIWHWREGSDSISHIAGFGFTPTIDTTGDSVEVFCWTENGCGAWQRETQRPNLAFDSQTGYLYCAFQWYDPVQAGATVERWPMADILVSVSTDNGMTWSDSTNVTDTRRPLEPGFCNPAPADSAWSERDMSVADRITYDDSETGFLHMEYEIDKDCGTGIGWPADPTDTHAITTLNPIVYRRIPVTQLPTSPIHDPDRLHQLHVATCSNTVTDADPQHDVQLPQAFRLYQNYPNPFNPATNIQFDLSMNSHVTLKVFNILGQEVATLLNNQFLSAGVHFANFDAAKLTSGVYIYRMEVNGLTQARKMMVLK
jgi:hypothetical protein